MPNNNKIAMSADDAADAAGVGRTQIFEEIRWLPGGKLQGREYVVRNPTRNDRAPGAFKIAASGSRAGAWADFATGDRGGDVVLLAAYLFGLPQSQAAKKLAEMLGVVHV